ncbi:MAG: DegV family protein [Chloroflexi bacterium]|nr:DegV family protein [Chloroflexota bacterium]
MRKVAIVADSTCCLPRKLVEKYHIRIVPLEIIYEDKSYRDGVDITPTQIYQIMRKKENLPTTSTAAVGDFLEAYREAGKEAKSVLCITLTSLQSQTFQAAAAARDIAKEEIPGTTVEVFDSRAVAGSLGFIVLAAARAAEDGADLAKCLEAAKNVMEKVNFLAMLDTLYYLARLGRIAKAAAWAGAMLNMKPILGHSPAAGVTEPVARPRTKVKAIERMLEIMAEKVGNAKVHVMVQHADELDDAKKLLDMIKSRFDCVESYLTEFTPVMGVHTGPGLLAIGFYCD